MMHGREKSDLAIVALKPPNKDACASAEGVERRAGTEGNAGQHSTCWTQSRTSASQVLACIRISRTGVARAKGFSGTHPR
jgi:RNA-directed DNA polymerase